jgi:hypothetical protein
MFDNTNLNAYRPQPEPVDHIYALFIALCSSISKNRSLLRDPNVVWRTRDLPFPLTLPTGHFMMGIFSKPGHQIIYILPDAYWDLTHFAATLDKTPEFDGHTEGDVIARLLALVK